MAEKKIITVFGSTGAQGGGLSAQFCAILKLHHRARNHPGRG